MTLPLRPLIVALGLALAIGAQAQATPVAPDPFAALSLIATPPTGPGEVMAVLYSGDGGWAAIDKGVAAALDKAGVPTVGVDSLHYFWTRKSPEAAAADLAAMIDRFGARWGRRQVLLIGYSFGADALPIIVAHLPPDVRSRVRLLALIGVSPKGDLQFHFGDWLNRPDANAYEIAPVLAQLKSAPIVCFYGEGEKDDPCPAFPAGEIRAVRLRGAHHFAGDYAGLGQAILQAMNGLQP